MTATAAKFHRTTLYSEKLLPAPYIGCGLSTDAHGNDMATLGEYSTLPSGVTITKNGRRELLQKGLRAFTRVADSNGIPDTDDYLRIHRAQAPGLPDPERLWTREWDEVMDRLKAGYAISIALRLSVLGPRNDIDFTTADHQALIWDVLPNGKTWCMGPMRDHSNTYHGHRATLADVRTAAKSIEGGLILTWLYPIGGWTAAKLATARLRKANAEADAENLRLERALAKCQLGTDDCAEQLAGQREAIADRLQEVVEEIREA